MTVKKDNAYNDMPNCDPKFNMIKHRLNVVNNAPMPSTKKMVDGVLIKY